MSIEIGKKVSIKHRQAGISYTAGDGIIINGNKISVLLREINNLIKVENKELFVDLQLPDTITPDSVDLEYPIGVNVKSVSEDDGRIADGLLTSMKTEDGKLIKIIIGDDGSIYVDRGDGEGFTNNFRFGDVYFEGDVVFEEIPEIPGYQKLDEKGEKNGYAPLDANGLVPSEHLPSPLGQYKGQWDASTGVYPDSTLLNAGDWYDIIVAGTIDGVDYWIGDEILWNKDDNKWDVRRNFHMVTSVNGKTGVVAGLEEIINKIDVLDLINPSSEKYPSEKAIAGLVDVILLLLDELEERIDEHEEIIEDHEERITELENNNTQLQEQLDELLEWYENQSYFYEEESNSAGTFQRLVKVVDTDTPTNYTTIDWNADPLDVSIKQYTDAAGTPDTLVQDIRVIIDATTKLPTQILTLL